MLIELTLFELVIPRGCLSFDPEHKFIDSHCCSTRPRGDCLKKSDLTSLAQVCCLLRLPCQKLPRFQTLVEGFQGPSRRLSVFKYSDATRSNLLVLQGVYTQMSLKQPFSGLEVPFTRRLTNVSSFPVLLIMCGILSVKHVTSHYCLMTHPRALLYRIVCRSCLAFGLLTAHHSLIIPHQGLSKKYKIFF